MVQRNSRLDTGFSNVGDDVCEDKLRGCHQTKPWLLSPTGWLSHARNLSLCFKHRSIKKVFSIRSEKLNSLRMMILRNFLTRMLGLHSSRSKREIHCRTKREEDVNNHSIIFNQNITTNRRVSLD